MIDEQYQQFRGVENGWQNTARAVYIDPTGLPNKYLGSVYDATVDILKLHNFMMQTDFRLPVIKDDIDWDSWSGFTFIAMRFNPVANPSKFGSAFLSALWEVRPDGSPYGKEWQGGGITLYQKAFPKWGSVVKTVNKVIRHEFFHILGVSHTNIGPSVINTYVIKNHDLNAIGYMPWDLCVAAKFMAGYDKGEQVKLPLPVRMNAHRVNVGSEQYLFIPAMNHGQKLFTVVLKNTAANAWQPVYWKRLDKVIDDLYNYQLGNVSDFYGDYVVMPLLYTPQGVKTQRLVKDNFGVWRLQ